MGLSHQDLHVVSVILVLLNQILCTISGCNHSDYWWERGERSSCMCDRRYSPNWCRYPNKQPIYQLYTSNIFPQYVQLTKYLQHRHNIMSALDTVYIIPAYVPIDSASCQYVKIHTWNSAKCKSRLHVSHSLKNTCNVMHIVDNTSCKITCTWNK